MPPRILLIDDDEAYAALVRALLPEQLPAGAVELVHETSIGAGAARLRDQAFDCILLDDGLPEGYGIESVAELRGQPSAPAIVLLSGTADAPLAARALRLGAHDALRKGAEVEGVLGPAVDGVIRRVRAADAVRAATAATGGVLDHTAEAVFVKDVDGRYAFVNPAWSRATGVLADDALGRTDAELLAPGRAALLRGLEARALTAGRPVRGELDLAGRRWSAVAFPLRRPDGAPAGLAGIAADVSAEADAQQALADERRHHLAILRNMPGMVVTLFDRHLRVVVMEGRLARSRGHDAEACRGQHLSEVFPNIHAVFEPLLRRALAGEEQRFPFRTPDGVQLDVMMVPQHGSDGGIEGVLKISRDVSAEREAQDARDRAERLFTSAFEGSPIGMAVTHLDGRYETANRALHDMLGFDDLVGRRWEHLTQPADLEDGVDLAAAVLRGEAQDYAAEERYLHADGHDVWVQVTASVLRDADGRPHRWFVQVVDITERRRFEERLDRMAHHDPLTGLRNRRGLEGALAEHLAQLARDGGGGALIVLDLDGFKVVNDTLGHSSGDQLIVSAAQVLGARLRETDVLARLGGDEFAVLLPSATPAQARHVALALCDAVREGASVAAGGRRRGVTVSAGVVATAADGTSAEALLVEADLAMYDAKEAGGDRVAVAGDAHDGGAPQMRDRVAWLERLRAAIEDERFVLHAQPIVHLATGAVDHHELLIRLPDGQGGLVPPGRFLPVAEQAGLICDLDRWVLRHALRALAAERLAGRPRRFSVNLSGRSIGRSDVLAELEAGLALPGADPGDLVVEMTETAAIGDVARAQRFAERLRELGVDLSLDDFGVGFGSFYELKHLPCDEVKVDGEFVRDCATSETDRLVIRSLVDLAGALGKRTVAEFVHDEATAGTVRSLGVDLGQGFHLGRPVPLEDVLEQRGP